MEREREIYYKEFAQVIMEAKVPKYVADKLDVKENQQSF